MRSQRRHVEAAVHGVMSLTPAEVSQFMARTHMRKLVEAHSTPTALHVVGQAVGAAAMVCSVDVEVVPGRKGRVTIACEELDRVTDTMFHEMPL